LIAVVRPLGFVRARRISGGRGLAPARWPGASRWPIRAGAVTRRGRPLCARSVVGPLGPSFPVARGGGIRCPRVSHVRLESAFAATGDPLLYAQPELAGRAILVPTAPAPARASLAAPVGLAARAVCGATSAQVGDMLLGRAVA